MTSIGLTLTPLCGIPSIAEGDDLAQMAFIALNQMNEPLREGDVLVYAQKIVSKAEGRSVALSSISPSVEAVSLAAQTGKEARLVELVLRESNEVIRQREGLLIVEHRLGLILANAGIDASNVDPDHVLLLPANPDASAARIRDKLRALTGIDVAVLVIDSIGRPWRLGTVGTAIGVSGIPALVDLRGRPDLNGRPLESTEVGLADELAAAASLVMGQAAEGTPIVLARGVPYVRHDGSAHELLRPKSKDLFR